MVSSSRMRPTKVSSSPAASMGMGYIFWAGLSYTRTPGACARMARASLAESLRSVSMFTDSEWP